MPIPGKLQTILEPLRNYEPSKLTMSDMSSSAVLIPVQERSDGHRLLLTKRSENLRHHPGQISFPGGRVDPGERPWLAALREAEEEIGLPAAAVRPVGRIDDVFSPRGFHIRCFVAMVDPFQPVLNPEEVDALVEVDLDELFDTSLHETKPWKDYTVHYFHFKSGTVWGVTGVMLYRLREILRQSPQTVR